MPDLEAPPDAAELRFELRQINEHYRKFAIWDRLLSQFSLYTDKPGAAQYAVQAMNYWHINNKDFVGGA